jgi:hypothetical protein
VVDTSVLVAGIAGLKPGKITLQNSSARMLRHWVENGTFIWLVTNEIILEYKTVLARLGVRRSTIGRVINLLSEEGEFMLVSSGESISPDPGDDPFCPVFPAGRSRFRGDIEPQGLSAKASHCSRNCAGRKNSHNRAQESCFALTSAEKTTVAGSRPSTHPCYNFHCLGHLCVAPPAIPLKA